MTFNSLIKGYKSLILLGADEKTSKNELKKIKLFNVFCLVWHMLSILMLIELVYDKSEDKLITSLVCLLMFLLLIVVQFTHYKKQYFISRLCFIFAIIILTFVFSNYTYKSSFLEYYFLFSSTISLIFFDSKKVNYSILVLSFLLFFFPNFHFKNYPDYPFNDISVIFLYFGIFIMVNYFKGLNIKNETALELKTKELEELNASQSQFFINVSHEIRTPLTLIKGEIHQLKEYRKDVPELVTIQNGLNTQVNKIADLVDDVLDVAKMESGLFKLTFSDVNLLELVSKVFHSFESAFKQKNISYALKKNTRNYIIHSDQAKLEKVLNNIISNALKFTEKGKSVEVELKKKKHEVIISISDTGIGIPEDDISKIYNKFFQVNNHINKTGGTGIGLSFCKKIIKLHKGKLQAKSDLNKGSTFSIFLPLKEVKGNKKEVKLTIKENNVRGILPNDNFKYNDAKILIVDDNWEMRKHIKRCLNNFTCLEAENGIEAIDIMKKQPIDFVIVDYMMPKMNGIEFIKSIRAQNYNTPLIMLTARADQESRLEVLRLGIDDYITKPFDRDELLLRIQNTLINYYQRIEYSKRENIDEDEIKGSATWIQKIRSFVEMECVNFELSKGDISEHFKISKSTLSRKIRSATGQKPNDFIQEIKLQKARRLAENNPEMSLKDLSKAVGYRHSYNFSKIYFEHFGNKPWNDN